MSREGKIENNVPSCWGYVRFLDLYPYPFAPRGVSRRLNKKHHQKEIEVARGNVGFKGRMKCKRIQAFRRIWECLSADAPKLNERMNQSKRRNCWAVSMYSTSARYGYSGLLCVRRCAVNLKLVIAQFRRTRSGQFKKLVVRDKMEHTASYDDLGQNADKRVSAIWDECFPVHGSYILWWQEETSPVFLLSTSWANESLTD